MTLWGLLLIGCMGTHRVGTMMDYRSAAEKERNVTRLLNVATRETLGDNIHNRTLALQQIGYLQSSHPDHVYELQELIDHPHAEIRRNSTWALGEIGRVLDWDEMSQRSMNALSKALLNSRTTLDAHFVLEAMVKTYTPHVHELKEDIELVRILQQYHANTPTPPDIFFLLTKSVQSLPVLLQLLSETQGRNSNEVYTINLDILRYLESNKKTLSQPQYRSLVQQTLQQELDTLKQSNQTIQLLSLWILTSAAHHGLIQEAIATKLVEMAPTLDGPQRLLIHSALWEMMETEVVRSYFRNMLRTQSHTDVLQWLGLLSDQVDLIQQLYTIQSPNGAP